MLHGDLSSELTYENFCQRIVIHVAIHGDDVNTKWREPLPSLWALAHGKGTAAHVDKVKILQTSALYLFHIVNWVTSWLLRNLKMAVVSTSSTAAHVEKVEILKTSALLLFNIANSVASWLERNLRMSVVFTSSTAVHADKVEILKTSALWLFYIVNLVASWHCRNLSMSVVFTSCKGAAAHVCMVDIPRQKDTWDSWTCLSVVGDSTSMSHITRMKTYEWVMSHT